MFSFTDSFVSLCLCGSLFSPPSRLRGSLLPSRDTDLACVDGGNGGILSQETGKQHFQGGDGLRTAFFLLRVWV